MLILIAILVLIADVLLAVHIYQRYTYERALRKLKPEAFTKKPVSDKGIVRPMPPAATPNITTSRSPKAGGVMPKPPQQVAREEEARINGVITNS